jgi:L-aminopeptidase/D-esterase-like protein
VLTDSLVDIAGLRVGHHTDPRRPTGCSVVLCETGAVCGVDQRGGAPGTRETDLLKPGNAVERVHAVLLTGGSAFGLDAASGVMRWLEERGHGLPVGPVRVPIVPAAVLFDLWLGDHRIRPDAGSGYAACEAASAAAPAQGSVGAGTGATVGKLFGIGRAMKGGIGTASLRVSGITVAALVAANPIGDVRDASGRLIAGARTADGLAFVDTTRALLAGEGPAQLMSAMAGTATTIGVVATDAVLDKAQAARLAALAHHGLSRSVSPLTQHDGDTLFALATGGAGRTGDLSVLGAMAADCVARAILHAVQHATGLTDPPLPSARELGTA